MPGYGEGHAPARTSKESSAAQRIASSRSSLCGPFYGRVSRRPALHWRLEAGGQSETPEKRVLPAVTAGLVSCAARERITSECGTVLYSVVSS